MVSSKWNKYNEQIDTHFDNGKKSWNKIARAVLGDNAAKSDIDLIRTYIKRRYNKLNGSIVDETLHRGNLTDNSWKVAWVKDTETGVSALVRNPDYKEEVVDYNVLRDELTAEMKALSPKVKKYKRKKIKDAHCLVLDVADLHIGKLATSGGVGEEYNVEIAVDRAIEACDSLIDKSKPYGIDKIFFIIGNDILHTDNPKRTTTSGTPQDTDGMWYDNFKVARMVYCSIISKLSTISDVEVIHCPSNHDYMSGFMLADAVSCYFHNNKNITFDVSNVHRKYTSYGLNMLSFQHGDGCKMDKIPYLAAHEAPQLWAATTYRYAYLHHLHHKQYHKFMSGADFIGMTVEHLRSPSGTDNWHDVNGYVGSKVAVEAFIHHPLHGQVCRLSHNFC